MSGNGCVLQAFVVALIVGFVGWFALVPASPSVMVTPSAPVEVTAVVVTEVPYQACVWNWHSEPQPQIDALLAEQVLSVRVLRENGAVITAIAFGENCNTPNNPPRFAAMQTDFTLTLTGNFDDATLGMLVGESVAAIDAVATLTTFPGPNPGYLDLVVNGSQRRAWLRELRTALAAGETGAALLAYFE
ncbi:MAG: hypothetical protein SF029_21910 [bacterium]|nr:hypothetical protein [bacterium]